VRAAEVIIQRIAITLISNSILYRSKAEYLIKVAKKTAGPMTAKCFLFTKAPDLKLADAIHGGVGPVVRLPKMLTMDSLRALHFLMISLHTNLLSGSARLGALPW